MIEGDIPFQINEMRPETSKCSRGTSNKFNKTLTGGFNINDSSSSSSNYMISSSSNNFDHTSVSNNSNSMRIQMNMTGFNFRQSKPLETTTTTTNNGGQQPNSNNNNNQAQGQQQQQQQGFSTTSQGFYKHRKQNSFASGMTLEQYFQAPSPEENSITSDTAATTKLLFKNPFPPPPPPPVPQNASLVNQNNNNLISSQSAVSATTTSPPAHYAHSNQNSPAMDEPTLKVEEEYNQEDFEIHEESCEEQDEDDDDQDNNANSMNNRSRKFTSGDPTPQQQQQDSIYSRNGGLKPKIILTKSQKNRGSFENNSQNYEGNFEVDSTQQGSSSSTTIVHIKPGQRITKVDQNATRTSLTSSSTNATIIASNNNITNNSNNNNNNNGLENIAEEAIQRKIREKYYKKTVYKHYQNPQVNSTTDSSLSSSSSSTGSNVTASSKKPTQQQYPSPPNQQILSGHSFPHNNSSFHAAQSVLMSSNAANQIPTSILQQQQQQSTSTSSSVFARSTNTNFYSENQNGYDSFNGFTPVNAPQQSKQSIAVAAAAAAATQTQSRKTNRSQSPMYSIKRVTNLVSTQSQQQRQTSKEPAAADSFMDDCRRTFQMKDKSGMVNIGSKVNSQQPPTHQIDSHIAFRTSFYTKPQQQHQALNQQQQQQTYQSNSSAYVSQHQGVSSTQNTGLNLRLTVNEFYKNPHANGAASAAVAGTSSIHESNGLQPRGSFQTGYYYHHHQNNNNNNMNSSNINNNRDEDYLTDALMRRTAKENKFLNQKDKITEMAREDANYLTKHAARFNIHPAELAAINRHKN